MKREKRTELRRLTNDAIAARHIGANVAIEAMHTLQRAVSVDVMLELLDALDTIDATIALVAGSDDDPSIPQDYQTALHVVLAGKVGKR